MTDVKISFPTEQRDKDFAKRCLGFIGFIGFICIFLTGVFLNSPSMNGLLFSALIFVLSTRYFNKTVWSLADEVWDCGDFLRVKKSGKCQNIYFSDIKSIDHPYRNHEHLITIKTRVSIFAVCFRATKNTSPGRGSPEVLTDLQSRIN